MCPLPGGSLIIGGPDARRAIVVPRCRLSGEIDALPIEVRLAQLLARGATGWINLVGPPGSGKTTALRHLCAVLDPATRIVLIEGAPDPRTDVFRREWLVLFTSPGPLDERHFATLHLTPWSDDDIIEYLLATHPGRCRAVMATLKKCRTGELRGLPELWRIVLDEMAADDTVRDLPAALERFLDRELCDARCREEVERRCLAATAPCTSSQPVTDTIEPRFLRLIRHPPVRALLAARRLIEVLCRGEFCAELSTRLPPELIERCGLLAAAIPRAIVSLEAMTRQRESKVHAMAASILHASGIGWRPHDEFPLKLNGAALPGARWPGLRLKRGELARADLRQSTLVGADLSGAQLHRAVLAGSAMRDVCLRDANLCEADLSGCDLRDAYARGAELRECNLSGADLSGAVLHGALLCGADLRGARLCGAELREADLRSADIDGADLSDANLAGAVLRGLSLCRTVLDRVRFRGADLIGCDLEGVQAIGADFGCAKLHRALLTGTTLPHADFHSADLRNSGLADVDWERVDLRDADLRGASFHLGSTRSGLVGSDVPCHGSRTGFYTDDYQDRQIAGPRQVRKANLCGADLRGANIEGVDFYLVDLRGARYTADQAHHFAQCGAILCEGEC